MALNIRAKRHRHHGIYPFMISATTNFAIGVRKVRQFKKSRPRHLYAGKMLFTIDSVCIATVIGTVNIWLLFCRYGKAETLEKLLEKQNTKIINMQNNKGRTALHYACAEGHDQAAEFLLKLGAIVEKWVEISLQYLYAAFIVINNCFSIQHTFNVNYQVVALFSDEMRLASHCFFSGCRQEVNSTWYSEIEEPIKSREKHYSLVVYMLLIIIH